MTGVEKMDRTELKPSEPHPASYSALKYVSEKLNSFTIEAFASCAIESNRLAEVCIGTINRLKAGEPVSDRYLLGLAWALREMDQDNG